MKTIINRRNWLKTGVLTAGGLAVAPYFSFGEMPRAPLKLDFQGNALYSPFFKEYLPSVPFPTPKTLLAKLNANENPYGPSPKAIEALKDVATKGNRYAWTELFDLIDKIAKEEGVDPKNIMMGPGSSDLLEKTAMVLFMNGGNVVSADPSYMSLVRVAEATGASWKAVPLKDWAHDLKAMEAAIDSNTKLVYICNPNNPTGSMTDSAELVDFCARVSEKVPVFVDEAYMGFLEDGAKQSMVSLINKGKDVIIARTFSKIHGMAGLRVGYIVAQEFTLDKIQKITRGGMGIAYTSIFAAMASMDDLEFQNKSRKLNAEAREYVYKSLKKLGYDYVSSSTSFILFPIEMEGKAFLDKMTALGVGVRAFQFMDKNWCRVSMGTLDEMKVFAGALEKVLT